MKKWSKNRFGIVTLEYAAIAILVLLGILVIGPAVLRSINAYFYSMEEGAKDSFREEFKQADPDEITTQERLNECYYYTTYRCSTPFPNQLASITSSSTATCNEILAREQGAPEHLLTETEIDIYYGWKSANLIATRVLWEKCPVPEDKRSVKTKVDGSGLAGTSSLLPCGLECCLPPAQQKVCACLDNSDSYTSTPCNDDPSKLLRYYVQQCGENLDFQNFWEKDPDCVNACDRAPSSTSLSQGPWCSGNYESPNLPLNAEVNLELKFVPWGPSLRFCEEDGQSRDVDQGPNDFCDPTKAGGDSCDACYAQCNRTFLPYDTQTATPAWVGDNCACPPGWGQTDTAGWTDGCPAGYTKIGDASDGISCPDDTTAYDLDYICWYYLPDMLGGTAPDECP